GGKTYLDYVYSIQTRTWETKRIEQRMGASWIIGPERYTFSEGDMAVLVLFPDAPSEMFWKTDAAKTEPYIRETPHYFSYTEKLDYTPVYIEFDPEGLPDEVGVYINGQCKGAAVVDFDLLEVNLYDDAAKSDDFEILCYYEGKGTKSMKGWTIFNPESLVFEKVPLNGVNTERYIYISFTREAGSPALPLTTSLEPNYPNPFNPETRISFTLADPMPVKLEIYNLKGQRVKTLLAGELSRGRHSLHWNAKDEQNRKVASGIYFYKLSTSTGHYTAKMMLMK
ncbi:MAG: FlgD immunoglobulin-like domain containing protein, partial [Candidatus Cloacimonetes bacterium]|nr:FlgD immunoglobulin-like domain containing protein [Candidatus Cloacimonadota bacterium]